MVDQRVEHVRHRGDPALDGDLLVHEPARIPRAVDPLVVRQRHHRRELEKRLPRPGQHAVPDLRVRLHHGALRRAEGARLVQDHVGDGELADVVQGARDSDELGAGRVEADPLGEERADGAHPLGVGARLAAVRLDGAGEPPDRLLAGQGEARPRREEGAVRPLERLGAVAHQPLELRAAPLLAQPHAVELDLAHHRRAERPQHVQGPDAPLARGLVHGAERAQDVARRGGQGHPRVGEHPARHQRRPRGQGLQAGVLDHQRCAQVDDVPAERRLERRLAHLVEIAPHADGALVELPPLVHEAHRGHGHVEGRRREVGEAVEGLLTRRVEQAEIPERGQPARISDGRRGRVGGGGAHLGREPQGADDGVGRVVPAQARLAAVAAPRSASIPHARPTARSVRENRRHRGLGRPARGTCRNRGPPTRFRNTGNFKTYGSVNQIRTVSSGNIRSIDTRAPVDPLGGLQLPGAGEHRRVGAAPRGELVVRAALHHPAAVEHHDLLGVADG